MDKKEKSTIYKFDEKLFDRIYNNAEMVIGSTVWGWGQQKIQIMI